MIPFVGDSEWCDVWDEVRPFVMEHLSKDALGKRLRLARAARDLSEITEELRLVNSDTPVVTEEVPGK
jgi:hypothetical protein